MNLPAHDAHLGLPQSTFYMLRCVVAVASADNIIKEQELLFLRALLAHYKRHMVVSTEQVNQLKEDIRVHQPIDALLPYVTERSDREQLILFAGLLSQADGDIQPAEEAILQKIRSHCSQPGMAEPVPDLGGGHPPSTPAQVHVMPAVVPVQSMDMAGFMQEVRDVVKQEFYKQAIATSGIAPKTSRAAVVDAFVEKNKVVPAGSYDALTETPKMSRAMRQSMVGGERLLGKARFHYIYTVYSLIISGLILVFSRTAANWIIKGCQRMKDYLTSGGANWLGEDNVEKLYAVMSSPLWNILPIYVLCGSAILFFLWRVARQLTTEIVVTDSRVVAKQGIFSVRTFKTDLSNLGQVDVNQSMLGNLLNYGSVHIFTRNWSGQGNQMEVEGIYLPPIAEPHSFSTLVDRARRMWRTRTV
ncbi:MAG: PH domain-containing protein [Alphaproteobacteria bacterium]